MSRPENTPMAQAAHITFSQAEMRHEHLLLDVSMWI